jgi:5-methylcytosine-specific restriction endonuclease McrA
MPKIPCQQCQNIFYVKPVYLTKGYGKYCSQGCYGKSRSHPPRVCAWCGQPFQVHKHNKIYCSRLCYRSHEKAINDARHAPGKRRCSQCKQLKRVACFNHNVRSRSGYLAACKPCEHKLAKIRRKRNPEKTSIANRTRKARKRHAPIAEHISLDVIFIRDHQICSLCHTRVKRKEASVDHIIPLSKGGMHSYVNCALAHKRCNSSKNNRLVLQQLRLF